MAWDPGLGADTEASPTENTESQDGAAGTPQTWGAPALVPGSAGSTFRAEDGGQDRDELRPAGDGSGPEQSQQGLRSVCPEPPLSGSPGSRQLTKN